MTVSPEWTEQEIATLRQQWEAGVSASVIGLLLSKTRNAVIGKVHRLRLKGRVTTQQAAYRRVPPPPLPYKKPVRMTQLRWHHCRAVIDAREPNKADPLHCGQHIVEMNGRTTPWCIDHYRQFYQRRVVNA